VTGAYGRREIAQLPLWLQRGVCGDHHDNAACRVQGALIERPPFAGKGLDKACVRGKEQLERGAFNAFNPSVLGAVLRALFAP
jgi:hypothetical protein